MEIEIYTESELYFHLWDVGFIIFLFLFRTRLAGLCGLRGVIKKIGHQDLLQLNIWDIDHMNKIVPPFLFNMEDSVKLVPIYVAV